MNFLKLLRPYVKVNKFVNIYSNNTIFNFLAEYLELFRIMYDTGPNSDGVVTLKTGRREVPDSNPGRACRPSRSEFFLVFSETHVNMS